jgi:hypothetical protein
MTLRPFGTKVHNFVTLLVKVCVTVVLQYAQFDCYSQPIITRQTLSLFPRRFHPLVAFRGIYRLQYHVNSQIRGVQNKPYTFILRVALLLRIGVCLAWLNYIAAFLSPSDRMPTQSLKLGYSSVFPRPFQFTIHQWSHHSILWKVHVKFLDKLQEWVLHTKTKKPVYVNIRGMSGK